MTDCDTFTLAPGHELRRASETEIGVIKGRMQEMLTHSGLVVGSDLWERSLELPGSPGGSRRHLPANEWRYFVVTFKGSNERINDLMLACEIAPIELEVGPIFLNEMNGRPAEGIMWHPHRIFHLLEYARWNRESFFREMSSVDLDAIASIYELLQRHDPEKIDVKSLTRQLYDLKGMPHRAPLRFLGYFAVLESLLTHPPQPNDPYDSITRQVKRKLTLLNSRFQPTIDYAPFGQTDPETIWTKMYKYRSLLAHGVSPTFNGDLKVLRDHETSLTLLKETVKAVLRQALVERQLLIDLREC